MTEIPIPLLLKLRKNGFDYAQIHLSGRVYIYEPLYFLNIPYYKQTKHSLFNWTELRVYAKSKIGSPIDPVLESLAKSSRKKL
jgi:hypothetical protein